MGFVMVIGDELEAIYKNGRLVTQGHLTTMDVLEACDVPCDIYCCDIEWQQDRGGLLPELLSEVKFDGGEDEEEIEGLMEGL